MKPRVISENPPPCRWRLVSREDEEDGSTRLVFEVARGLDAMDEPQWRELRYSDDGCATRLIGCDVLQSICERIASIATLEIDESDPPIDRPTYDQLLVLYFNAERRCIAERSGNIRADTLKVWRQCREWANVPSSIQDDSGLIEDHLLMEKEEGEGEP